RYLSISAKELEKADRWFTRYGAYILLFTWMPLVGDAITVSGGLLKLDFRIFSIYVFIGKFARYLALAYIAASI
uniref:YqaA family protein n=1 Tax=Methanomethylovorans sp. TaxID=2758717 RepID=UPI00351C047F